MVKLIIILLFGVVDLLSQNLNINGYIADTTGTPLPGVNVTLIGTNLGTASDFNGRFSIKNLKPGKYSIEFSFIGYKTKTFIDLLLNEKSISINVILRQQLLESEQVITSASKYEQKIAVSSRKCSIN